jgi:putative addiction module component (TIGR02574 family)
MGLMTIEKRVLRWPAAKKVALAEKLLDSVENFASHEIEEAWESELQERVMEIEKGKAVGIPANVALSKARRILSEARRLPQARRKRAD